MVMVMEHSGIYLWRNGDSEVGVGWGGSGQVHRGEVVVAKKKKEANW